ncbi:MAG: hypothetical protein ACYDEO_28325 [Aggregatilineales bacterium]
MARWVAVGVVSAGATSVADFAAAVVLVVAALERGVIAVGSVEAASGRAVVVAASVVGLLSGRLSGGSNNASNQGSESGLSSQPPSVQTQTVIDLFKLHAALDTRIFAWENQVSVNQEQHVSAADAGMANDNNIKDVVYGKCDVGFFVFVVDKGAPTNAGNANGQGYAYIGTVLTPEVCHPLEYQVTDYEDDGAGWWFVYLHS